MFSRSQSSSKKQVASGSVPSIISADMRVAGDLKTEGDIQVDGVVDGDIHSTSISIGRTAEINGEIIADTIRIWGKVKGRICGRDVALLETAEVQGDIVHETLEISRGARFDGMVKRQDAGTGLAAEDHKQPRINLVVAEGGEEEASLSA